MLIDTRAGIFFVFLLAHMFGRRMAPHNVSSVLLPYCAVTRQLWADLGKLKCHVSSGAWQSLDPHLQLRNCMQLIAIDCT
jgi:hypothetical protein